MTWETQYLDLLTRIILDGERRTYRNGDRISLFRPPRIEVDLTREFPLVTTRRINWEFARDELLWFLGGSDNTMRTTPLVARIWAQWVKPRTGSIGDSYGSAWRGNGVREDQLAHLVSSLRVNPTDSGQVVTLWHPDAAHYQMRRGGIRPCHGTVIQCYVREGRYLDLSTYQRSADVPVGVPYNIASYALLALMLAQQTGYTPGRLVYDFGDAHIYADQLGLVGEQLVRTPDPGPSLALEHPGTFDGGAWPYAEHHITLTGYAPQPHIPYPVSA